MRPEPGRLLRWAIFFAAFGLLARADTGVLLPHDKQAPDATILSLAEMSVDILIDNDDARIRITQIFANHTGRPEEGTYIFALPDRSSISDFAVWDGPVRIPAVILERRRAEDIYDKAMQQAIDPGLLEMGEPGNAEHGDSEQEHRNTPRALTFSAKIVPIPAWGTKRLELEYHQKLSVTDWKQFFLLPLKPDAYHQQQAGHLKIHFEIRAEHTLTELRLFSKLYPMTLTPLQPADGSGKKDASGTYQTGNYQGDTVSLDEDFGVGWTLDPAGADTLHVITYRDPSPASTPFQSSEEPPPETGGAKKGRHQEAGRHEEDRGQEPGFFEAQIPIGDGVRKSPGADESAAKATESRTRILLFDNSLSMQWDKLERSYAALEALLRSLHPDDRFNIILFNQETMLFVPQPVTADSATREKALQFVRSSKLRGGTDIGKALSAGLKQCSSGDCALVMMTDGGSDRGETVIDSKIAANYSTQWKNSHRPRTDVFAVGDDANLRLLKMLAQNDGVLEHVLSSEPAEFKLDSFLSKISRSPIASLALNVNPAADVSMVYPLDDAVYTRSTASWIGQYNAPAKKVEFNVKGNRDDGILDAAATVDLPGDAREHVQLPRLWAEARVNALLDQIARDGETREAVDEIIRLARKYKLLTPYTSFLAAPRALLRPRVIQPGDPVLRVHTDPLIVSVIALFPFGLTKPLRHLSGEDTRGDNGGELWETRFLAPDDMKDGTYTVRLILRDRHGSTYREAKTFVIASTPPAVKIVLDRRQLHRGETLLVKASASASTRTLTARLEGAAPVSMRWTPSANMSTGSLALPPDLPLGRYTLTVTAEDIAHNMGSTEVQVEVIP